MQGHVHHTKLSFAKLLPNYELVDINGTCLNLLERSLYDFGVINGIKTVWGSSAVLSSSLTE
jgi:hypothetical protein